MTNNKCFCYHKWVFIFKNCIKQKTFAMNFNIHTKYILLLWLTFLIEKGGMMQEIHDVNMLHGNSPTNSKNITMRYKRYETNDIERKHNRIDKVKIMQQERSHFSKNICSR